MDFSKLMEMGKDLNEKHDIVNKAKKYEDENKVIEQAKTYNEEHKVLEKGMEMLTSFMKTCDCMAPLNST
eukprot:CAMPEP_0194305482 /NCGR_PEP_ID=MMETSP0171-20130528/2912_1 /TAXON_ID=218684 /ORGANISM="Corethron pennatum, Strain L29A3" /LENGTH=69 /DNA_ID=CAMNT_0039057029 /DNA_START=119 /DNA_END=328 /DNA_ORIENTATION=-